MKTLAYVGTYTNFMESTGSEGIYILELDEASGNLSIKATESNCFNPSYLIFSKDNSKLYAVNENFPDSAFSAYEIKEDGTLKLINSCNAPGAAMCHLALDESEKWIFGANFFGGNIVWTGIGQDGELDEDVRSLQHIGKSITPEAQDSPHVHQVVFGPDQLLIVVDLGIDRLMLYRFNEQDDTLKPNPAQSEVTIEAGEGPRHFVFHPNMKYAYVITELKNNLILFDFDQSTGKFTQRQTVPLLPDEQGRGGAEIQITADGRYIFASARSRSCIVRYTIGDDGYMSKRTEFDCHGLEPRMFSFTPDEAYVLIANQGSDNVVSCSFNKDTGEIGSKLCEVSIPKPSFVQALRFLHN